MDALHKKQQENIELTKKTDDFENHSRSKNLCVVVLPRDCEGGEISAFMSKILDDLLKDNSVPYTIL